MVNQVAHISLTTQYLLLDQKQPISIFPDLANIHSHLNRYERLLF